MSFTTVIFPIIAALIAPEGKFLDKNVLWNAINNKQKYFLENIYTPENKQALSLFSNDELKSWASTDHNELNQIAKDNGFDIRFNPFIDGFGTLSILNILLKWKEKGESTFIKSNNKNYKAAKLNKEFLVFSTANYKHPIVMINTQNDQDTVYMTVADVSINEYDQILEKVKFLKNQLNNRLLKVDLFDNEFMNQYDELIFPNIDINQQENITWLINMYEKNYFIDQALQQTKFKMNEEGAHVQSAVMIGFARECASLREKTSFVIDKPFFIWIERKGTSLPIFAGYIDQSDWQKLN